MNRNDASDESAPDFEAQRSRLNQAIQKGAELGASIQTWVANNPWNLEAAIDDDRHAWQISLKVNTPPLLDEWGFIFGEAVHHLRALLDNAVVAIGKQSGVQGKDLRQTAVPDRRFS